MFSRCRPEPFGHPVQQLTGCLRTAGFRQAGGFISLQRRAYPHQLLRRQQFLDQVAPARTDAFLMPPPSIIACKMNS